MPAGKVVPAFDRRWLALVLTVQVFVGASFGIEAQLVQVRTDPAAVAHSRFWPVTSLAAAQQYTCN